MSKAKAKLVLLVLLILSVCLLVSARIYPVRFIFWNAKNENLTNPLLKFIKFRELQPFRQKVADLIEKEKAAGLVQDVSVYFRSLADGIWFGINEREQFAPASILKIPVMLTYFRLSENNPDILKEKIRYKTLPSVYGYTPGVKQASSAKQGEYYTVDQLIKFLITESDNNADKLLLDNLPPGELDKTFDDFGIHPAIVSPTGDFASLKICAGLLRVLYNASYVNEELSQKALEYLSQSTYKQGILAGIPDNVIVAHKFGERFFTGTDKKELHEIAIVYYVYNPYILTVMTKGTDFNSLSKVIKDISALVYDEIDAQYKVYRRRHFMLNE